MTSDASDIVTPNLDGAVRAMRGALRDAGLPPEEIGYINAHGTGTTANDKTECAAVRAVFGAHADRLMISSTKSMHGHLIGGTGAVELVACLMALREGVIAPTINYDEPDPECDLDVVPNVARERPRRRGDDQRLRLRRAERGAGAQGLRLSRGRLSSAAPAGRAGSGSAGAGRGGRRGSGRRGRRRHLRASRRRR